MKLQFKETPEQLELIRKMGSKNRVESMEAQETFATLIAPTVGQVFLQADTTSLIYRDMPFVEGTDPSFPLELFTDVPEGYFTIWSQAMPGGLPTNTVMQPINEIKFTTYRLDSAVSYLKKYAAQTRLPVIARAIERLMQEILVKTQNNAWAVALAALAGASHNGNPHVYRSMTAGVLTIDDFSKMLTKFRRLNRSWVGGTPVGGATKPTDMVISPEIMEQMRSMAYNPINTKAPNGITPDADSAAVTLTEADRKRIYDTGGVPEFFGISIIELLELGVDQNYNVLFGEFSTGNINKLDGTAGAAFNASADELVLVIDATKDFAYRAIQTDSDTKSVFTLQPDDQFVGRSGKIGSYGAIEEGRLVLDTRGLFSIVV